jgi:hypothetical protein
MHRARAGGSLEMGLKYYVGAANLPDDGGYAERVLSQTGLPAGCRIRAEPPADHDFGPQRCAARVGRGDGGAHPGDASRRDGRGGAGRLRSPKSSRRLPTQHRAR